MQLDNQTPFAARLFGIDRTEENVDAFVVLKSTFDLDEAGKVTPSKEQVPIVGDRLETPFGVFHTDCFVRKEGVDVCVLGTVRLGRPTRVARLILDVEGHQAALNVFGDRRWVCARGTLQASDPVAFEEMPLGYARAYGGVSEYDHESVAWADNPVGRGYYLSPQLADGQPLPNIEQGQGPGTRTWSDQAPVAGWGPYPLFWGLRAKLGIESTHTRPQAEQGLGFRVRARLNNNAHPALVVPRLEPGAVIRILGLRDRELVIPVPRVVPLLEADVGGRVIRAGGALDGVFVWADAGRVTLTHRVHFSYAYRKGERRQARLLDANVGARV